MLPSRMKRGVLVEELRGEFIGSGFWRLGLTDKRVAPDRKSTFFLSNRKSPTQLTDCNRVALILWHETRPLPPAARGRAGGRGAVFHAQFLEEVRDRRLHGHPKTGKQELIRFSHSLCRNGRRVPKESGRLAPNVRRTGRDAPAPCRFLRRGSCNRTVKIV